MPDIDRAGILALRPGRETDALFNLKVCGYSLAWGGMPKHSTDFAAALAAMDAFVRGRLDAGHRRLNYRIEFDGTRYCVTIPTYRPCDSGDVPGLAGLAWACVKACLLVVADEKGK